MSENAAAPEPAETPNKNPEITKDDIERSAKPPAIFADAYFVSVWSGHLRIAFGETLGGISRYSTAVVLPLADAEDLATDIAEYVQRQKVREKERE